MFMFIFLLMLFSVAILLLSLLIFSFLFSVLRKSFIIFVNNHNSAYCKDYGPISYPIIGCLMSFYENRRRLLDWYTDLVSCSPTSTIVVQRLGALRTVVTANPTNVEYIVKTNFANFPKGKPFTEILGDLLGCGIFNVDGELWSTQRKLASHEFSARSLREFVVKTLEEEVRGRLIPLLENAAENGTVLDLQEVLKRFAFDTICKVSLGHDPCCLDMSRPAPSLFWAFDSAAAISAKRSTEPVALLWKMKRLFRVGSEKKLREAIGIVRRSVSEIIKNKRKTLEDDKATAAGGARGDMLSRFLMAGHEEEVVRDMVISFIMAGRDTTSAAMTWLFWLLSQNPEAEKLLLNEVSRYNDHSNDISGGLNYDALQEMSFLKACLCETMRLYPPVSWDSKHAANDDVLPDGTVVRRGDRVTFFPYGMGRIEELWGKDCLEFKPDRWLDEPSGGEINGHVLKAVSPFKFPVFQAGPRVCLGKEMAFTQMKYVVASVLNRFEIRPVCLDRPLFVPLLTAHMAGGLRISVTKRGVGSHNN
ncbi:cytochrome P450 94B3-like [Humulus lupulus]|uniref:cytochrome P450 94B3-like n=1 Tax=Humulus lupulus TaxID=3486 RepID=UPI002B4069BE|nr:cytochrome P450 94B3-like [Humulus lupulus]